MGREGALHILLAWDAAEHSVEGGGGRGLAYHLIFDFLAREQV